MIHSDNLDMSLSGLKTSVLYTVQKIDNLDEKVKSNIAASFQKAVSDLLIAKTTKAIKITDRKDLIIAGGVAANKFIRNEFKNIEEDLDIKVYYPDLKYCGDNAAMIAFVGSKMSQKNKRYSTSKVRARWPLDELKQ